MANPKKVNEKSKNCVKVNEKSRKGEWKIPNYGKDERRMKKVMELFKFNDGKMSLICNQQL